MPRWFIATVFVLASGCSLVFPAGDLEGIAPDASVGRDGGGPRDGGARRDGGVEPDGGIADGAVDGGVARDGGGLRDGGVPRDGGGPLRDGGARDAGPLCAVDAGRIFCASFDDRANFEEWDGTDGVNASLVPITRTTMEAFSPPASLSAETAGGAGGNAAGHFVFVDLTDGDLERTIALRYRLSPLGPAEWAAVLRLSPLPPTGQEVYLEISGTQLRVRDGQNIGVGGPFSSGTDWHQAEITIGGASTIIRVDGIQRGVAPWSAPFPLGDIRLAVGLTELFGPWPAMTVYIDDVEVRP
ncbi:MAG: hypothetical protein RIT81_13460 [Deltaproteobacteria bacterium]